MDVGNGRYVSKIRKDEKKDRKERILYGRLFKGKIKIRRMREKKNEKEEE